MARKAIIELAKDKGMTEFVPIGSNALWEQIEKFVDFAVEEEREACAKVCDAMRSDTPMGLTSRINALFHAALSIRARGEV